MEIEALSVPAPPHLSPGLTSPPAQNSLGEGKRQGGEDRLTHSQLQLFTAPGQPAARGCFLPAHHFGRAVVTVTTCKSVSPPSHPWRPSLTSYNPDHPDPVALWDPPFPFTQPHPTGMWET